MDAATTASPRQADADSATLDRAPASSKVPRSLPNSLAKDFAFVQPRAASPMFAVSAEYDADSSDCEGVDAHRTLRAKGAFAPTSSVRTHSPAPLLWSEAGWNAGSFTFAPLADSATPQASPEQQDKVVDATEPKSSDGGSSEVGSVGAVAQISTSSTSAPTSGPASPNAPRSKLAPTAQPFAPKVSPLTPVTPRPRAPALDIVTSLERYAFPAATAYNDHSAASSPLEPVTPPSHRHLSHSSISSSGTSQFDCDGRLLSQGAKYNIADEILQLQSTGGMHPDEVETLETLEFVEPGAPVPRMRAVSEDSSFARGIETWRLQQQQQQPFPTMRQPGVGAGSAPFERTRSSSIASTASSYFSPAQTRPAFERANTVAQLQSYFGTSPGDVSVQLPGGFDTYAPSYAAGHSAPLSPQASYASLAGAGAAAAYPPLAHPEPFNLTPDDPLYIEARNVFIESSCTSLSAPPTPAHQQTMGAHFDRAMHQLHPLATLYGLSQDAANQLLADPAKSGVSDVVLKVAAMMGRQQQMASVQRSAMGAVLPGPSPNNRKLALYKTELCRSWDERSGCRYGIKCQFAHGVHELREIVRHPKFKSEICRTFWQQGACPYGKRCCFIHAMPDASSPLSSPRKDSVASSRAASPRPQGRMTSTAVTGAPSRTFGPALSELISSSSSSSATSSPIKQSHREGMQQPGSASSSTSSFETSTLFGLGIRERPGQAPPTYKDAPQSRLQRLASLSAGPSSSSLVSLGQSSPTVPTSSAGWHGAPHARHDSANSFVSSGSSVPSLAHSPLLTRTGSSSSLSSAAGSPVLHRVAGDWLSGPAHHAGKSGALDWPAIEELSLDDPPATVGSALYGRAAFA
ncbi:hypothetical protein JCM10450v2_001269 [Rhodotorula kratochvilovae]